MRSQVEIEAKLQTHRSLLRTVDDYRDPDGATELRHWIRALEWVLGPQDANQKEIPPSSERPSESPTKQD
jgi:hypothetical protein